MDTDTLRVCITSTLTRHNVRPEIKDANEASHRQMMAQSKFTSGSCRSGHHSPLLAEQGYCLAEGFWNGSCAYDSRVSDDEEVGSYANRDHGHDYHGRKDHGHDPCHSRQSQRNHDHGLDHGRHRDGRDGSHDHRDSHGYHDRSRSLGLRNGGVPYILLASVRVADR